MKLTKKLISELSKIINQPKNIMWYDEDKTTHHIVLINDLVHSGKHSYCFNYKDYEGAEDEYDKLVKDVSYMIKKSQYVVWVQRRGKECMIFDATKIECFHDDHNFKLS